MNTKLPTIRDVARRANVSAMSVSNFINDKRHLMAEETRERIRQAIADLEYRPRSQARGFRQRRDFSVGLVVVNSSANFLAEPFLGHVMTGLSTELASEGYACLVQGLPFCTEDDEALKNFSRADGLCVFASGSNELRRRFYRKLAGFGVPIVLIGENELPEDLDIALVAQDDHSGAFELASHLIANGANSLIYAMPEQIWPATLARLGGFEHAIAASGRSVSLAKLPCGYGHFTEVQRAVSAWLDAGGRSDGILANNDHIGIAAIKILQQRGLRVPHDVMVTGFGAFDLWNYSDPHLTTIVSPAYDIGTQSARLLLDRLRTGQFAARRTILPISFRQADSTLPAK